MYFFIATLGKSVNILITTKLPENGSDLKINRSYVVNFLFFTLKYIFLDAMECHL